MKKAAAEVSPEMPEAAKGATAERYVEVTTWLLDARRPSRGELADQTGISQGEISKLVNGQLGNARIVGEKSWRLAHAMKCSPAEFVQLVRDLKSYGLRYGHSCLRIGKTQTLWWQATGSDNGEAEIASQNITVEWEPAVGEIGASPKLEDLAVEARREFGRKHGKNFENLRLGVASGEWGGSQGEDRRPWFSLTVFPTKYVYPFALRRLAHGREYIRERMQDWRPDAPIQTDVSRSLGVHVGIHCRDQTLMFAERSQAVGLRPGELDVGAVEGLSVAEDVSGQGLDLKTPGKIDIDRSMRRALAEEYGIPGTSVTKVTVLGLGFDMQYAQWNILGLADVAMTGAEVVESQKSAPDRFEHIDVTPIVDAPEEVFGFIARHNSRLWSSGLALAYFSLLRAHTKAEVDAAAANHDLISIRKFLWN